MRLIVLGTSGAGKSTFARRLAERRGCAFVDLDDLHWGPGWVEAAPEVVLARVRAAVAGESWAIAGNYLHLQHETWARATHLVWLDYSRARVVGQVLRRTAWRACTREPICNGNRESLRKALTSKDSILLWAWTTHARNRRRFDALFQAPPYAHLQLHRPRTPRESEALLDRLAGISG